MTRTKEGLEHYGYRIVPVGGRYYISWLVNGKRVRIQEHGKDKYLLSPEAAHAFIEKHARAQHAAKERQRKYTIHGSQVDYTV